MITAQPGGSLSDHTTTVLQRALTQHLRTTGVIQRDTPTSLLLMHVILVRVACGSNVPLALKAFKSEHTRRIYSLCPNILAESSRHHNAGTQYVIVFCVAVFDF